MSSGRLSAAEKSSLRANIRGGEHYSYNGSNALDPGAQIELSASVSGIVPDDSFTVDHAVNSLGFGKFQVKLSLITGLCWMADSMEMMILAIIGPALHCSWHLSEWQQAFLTTSVFLGMMISSAFWGHLSDKYGRRRSLRLAAVLLAYWGILSAFAPTYIWILFIRALVGVAIGCVPQSCVVVNGSDECNCWVNVIFSLACLIKMSWYAFWVLGGKVAYPRILCVTLYAEFLPAEHRGKCVVLLDCFWAVGACIEVVLALIVMPTLGWRGLLALSSLPLILFVIVCQWLPESARFDATSGNSERALSTLRRIASDNGKHMLLGRLTVDDVAQFSRGRIQDLLVDELKWTTFLLWFIWCSCAFCYYGVVLMTTELFYTTGDLCSIGVDSDRYTCSADCRPLSSADYVDILWTTLAEFPGILFTIFVIEKIGRKKTMALEFLIFVVSIIFLFACTSNRVWLTIIIFVARGIISGVFQAAYVYTPEVYPTALRSIGVGTCSGIARLGAMMTPLVAQVMLRTSVHLATATYGIVAVMAAAAAIMLPIETKGRTMN